jgi:hypothetical protein
MALWDTLNHEKFREEPATRNPELMEAEKTDLLSGPKKQRATHSSQNEWLVCRQRNKRELNFFDGDRVRFANFYATFTSEAFFLVHRVCLTVRQFINVHGAYIDTFGVASAFVFVYRNLPHLLFPPSSLELIKAFRARLNRGE